MDFHFFLYTFKRLLCTYLIAALSDNLLVATYALPVQWRREGGGRGGQLPPGAGTRGAPAKANKKKARPTKQRENNDSIQV